MSRSFSCSWCFLRVSVRIRGSERVFVMDFGSRAVFASLLLLSLYSREDYSSRDFYQTLKRYPRFSMHTCYHR